jgi:lipopolysaccharide/colanic/teichoic acid biosynthesis glycosyltransferase
MRVADRTPTLPSPSSAKTIDPAIVTNDWAPVFQFSRAAKRAFDIVAATIVLILLSPTFLLVAIAIRIDSRGPVFQSQTLHGYSNEDIPVLKFRTTMVLETGQSSSFVTVVGGALRRTGIDGLPQLINVLRGEMSIVGPSPYVAVPFLAEQISVVGAKPGITGWAQVNGCCGDSDTIVRQRIEFDQYYIENWSFLFDMKIILMTLFSKDAYLS